FTSGTTGNPKAVVHTYGNHWWSAIGSALNLGLDKQDKWLLPLPMFHVGGLSILIRSVIYGMEVYLMEKYNPKHLLQAFTEKVVGALRRIERSVFARTSPLCIAWRRGCTCAVTAVSGRASTAIISIVRNDRNQFAGCDVK